MCARFTVECKEKTKAQIDKEAKKEKKSIKDYVLDKIGIKDEE